MSLCFLSSSSFSFFYIAPQVQNARRVPKTCRYSGSCTPIILYALVFSGGYIFDCLVLDILSNHFILKHTEYYKTSTKSSDFAWDGTSKSATRPDIHVHVETKVTSTSLPRTRKMSGHLISAIRIYGDASVNLTKTDARVYVLARNMWLAIL